MIAKYGVNQFKFDGTGNANEVIKGSEFDSDFDAAIHLIGELRAKKPDIYINSRLELILRHSGCSTRIQSGAAATTTASPASARAASAGSPIATRKSIAGSSKTGRCSPSIR